MSNASCTHLDWIKELPKDKDTSVCEDCVKTGDTWVSLRQCLTCGHVGCCDSSKNKHATKHFNETGHPLMQSVTPGEEFRWCYIDQVYLDPQ
ncbi:MAG TPA: UBP-type zinc finger domain-containing protein [Candidatus Paceibacterota bacterium]|nr:UBP-type zinc finger domain-containing protein [Candidatus Paceibacterota bacterium]